MVFEAALKAHPTGCMYSLYSEYLRDCLLQQSAATQPQDDQLSTAQQATAEQLLQLYKRAYEAGEQRLHQQLVAWQNVVYRGSGNTQGLHWHADISETRGAAASCFASSCVVKGCVFLEWL